MQDEMIPGVKGILAQVMAEGNVVRYNLDSINPVQDLGDILRFQDLYFKAAEPCMPVSMEHYLLIHLSGVMHFTPALSQMRYFLSLPGIKYRKRSFVILTPFNKGSLIKVHCYGEKYYHFMNGTKLLFITSNLMELLNYQPTNI